MMKRKMLVVSTLFAGAAIASRQAGAQASAPVPVIDLPSAMLVRGMLHSDLHEQVDDRDQPALENFDDHQEPLAQW